MNDELCGLARVTEDATPEPMPVKISYTQCSTHGFFKISVPRDAGDRNPEHFKCPLRDCNS